MSTFLLTGAAGFIGYHVTNRLLDRGDSVVGLDNLNPYYNPSLKEARLARLRERSGFTFVPGALEDRVVLEQMFAEHRPDVVINLAAQSGVKYSFDNPHTYASSNLVGFLNVLELCRRYDVRHLVYASSSSVYGANVKMPFATTDNVDHPVSLYGATKKANELMAHTYSHLFSLPTTGLRFFTVYGPWGRPDMSMFLFTKAIIEERPIDVFNYGKMRRDFTFIDDIAEGVLRVSDRVPSAANQGGPTSANAHPLFRIYNIGNNTPIELLDMIAAIEDAVGKKAEQRLCPMRAGDVVASHADIDDLVADVGFRPATPLSVGVGRFVKWYRDYYGV